MSYLSNVFKILMISILSSNVIFSSSLGICSYLGVSKNKKSSIGMGFALTFVTVLATLISYPIGLLLKALNIEYMSTICFILVIASLVQFVEMFIKKFSPSLYKALGIYLPLITTNCVVLYVAKQTMDTGALFQTLGITGSIGGFASFVYLIVFALGIALGYFLSLYLFAVIREKLDGAPVVKGFQGVAIGLIVSAVMAIIFSKAFTGIF